MGLPCERRWTKSTMRQEMSIPCKRRWAYLPCKSIWVFTKYICCLFDRISNFPEPGELGRDALGDAAKYCGTGKPLGKAEVIHILLADHTTLGRDTLSSNTSVSCSCLNPNFKTFSFPYYIRPKCNRIQRVDGTSRDELTSLGPVRFRHVFRLVILNPGYIRKVGGGDVDGIVFGTTDVWAPLCRRSSTSLAQR